MTHGDQSSILQRLRSDAAGFSGSRRRVAEVILGDPVAASSMTITTLADQASTSPTTVSRLASFLGFSGYQAFRAAIALDSGRGVQAGWEQDIGAEIRPDDGPEQILQVLSRDQFLAMRATAEALDYAAVERLADLIVGARRVHLFGEWGDGVAALELHLRLQRIGIPTWHYSGAQEARITSNLLTEGDVAIAFALFGEDPVAEAFLRLAASRGATTALVSGARDTRLAKLADLLLHTGVGAGPHWTDVFAGRTSDALTAGLLWVLVAQRHPAAFDAMAGDRDQTEVELVVRPRRAPRTRR